MSEPGRVSDFRAIAGGLDRVDRPVYELYGRDSAQPIIGGGDARARLGVFGRDPGRHEVEHGVPFIGVGGQKVRRGLHEALTPDAPYDFAASLRAGRHVFWANTVPYKPIGNKAWTLTVQRQFRPLMAEVLVDHWQGRDILALGRLAFYWFGLADRAVHRSLDAHWSRDDRFESSLEVPLVLADGRSAVFRLHPLPHPSPLNATWAPHFPRLLAGRLAQLGWTAETWRLS